MDSRILFSFSLSTFPKPRLAFILFDSSFKIINLYLSIVLPFSLPPPSLLFRRFLSKRKVININRKESCLKGSSFNDQLFWNFWLSSILYILCLPSLPELYGLIHKITKQNSLEVERERFPWIWFLLLDQK